MISGVSETIPKRRRQVIPVVLVGAVIVLLLYPKTLDAQARQSSEGHLFWVQLCDFAPLGSVVREGIKHEVSAVFSRAGIALIWFEEESEAPIEIPPFLARIYILESFPNGLQQLFSRHSKQPMATILGKTPQGPGPLVYVSKRSIIERIREGRAVGLYSSHLEPVSLMVRAFSRVVTHELAHRFLRTSEHTSSGVLKPVLQGRDLIHPDPKEFLFSLEQGQRLRSLAARDYQQAPFASLLAGAAERVEPTASFATAQR
jgi:hypothetical protein